MEKILKNSKFTPLEKSQLKPIVGGKTGGDAKQNGPSRTEIKNGVTTTYIPMRSWESDYLNDKGFMCYDGYREYTDIVVSESPM